MPDAPPRGQRTPDKAGAARGGGASVSRKRAGPLTASNCYQGDAAAVLVRTKRMKTSCAGSRRVEPGAGIEITTRFAHEAGAAASRARTGRGDAGTRCGHRMWLRRRAARAGKPVSARRGQRRSAPRRRDPLDARQPGRGPPRWPSPGRSRSTPNSSRPSSPGVTLTTAERDFTVKVDARELEAARTYYYRFRAQQRTSPIGSHAHGASGRDRAGAFRGRLLLELLPGLFSRLPRPGRAGRSGRRDSPRRLHL